jgi:hypothetical protein
MLGALGGEGGRIINSIDVTTFIIFLSLLYEAYCDIVISKPPALPTAERTSGT